LAKAKAKEKLRLKIKQSRFVKVAETNGTSKIEKPPYPAPTG